MFRNIEFTLPPNYKEENDPYGDQWSRLSSGLSSFLGSSTFCVVNKL